MVGAVVDGVHRSLDLVWVVLLLEDAVVVEALDAFVFAISNANLKQNGIKSDLA